MPKPPFTPGYELVGVVEELGPGCSRLREGDRIGALTVWGADAERVCVPEKYAVEVPEDLDPAEVVSLVFPYMTAYQMLHRTARVTSGETVLVHGAAGRVGTAALELGVLAGLRLYGTASARDRPRSSGSARWRSTTGTRTSWLGCVSSRTTVWTSCSTGSVARCRFAPSARCGAAILSSATPAEGSSCIGNYNTMVHGRKSWRGWIEWYAATATVWLWGLLSPRRRVIAYRIQKLRIDHQDWFRDDFVALLELLRADKIHPVVAERLPLSEARRAHEMLERSAAKGKLVLVP